MIWGQIKFLRVRRSEDRLPCVDAVLVVSDRSQPMTNIHVVCRLFGECACEETFVLTP